MKTKIRFIYLLIIVLITSFSIKAQSFLSIQLNQDKRYYIYWDNIKYSQVNGTVMINEIFPGKHCLKIIEYSIAENNHFNHGNGHGHGHNNNFYSYRVIHDNDIYIPPLTETISVINRFDEFSIVRQEPISIVNNHQPNVCIHVLPMNDFAFSQLLDIISNTSFDSKKLQIANQAVFGNKLTSNQVFQIMQLFSFESSKLDFAKMAYSSCIDKNNYFLINKAFNFNSSVDELNDFIYN